MANILYIFKTSANFYKSLYSNSDLWISSGIFEKNGVKWMYYVNNIAHVLSSMEFVLYLNDFLQFLAISLTRMDTPMINV